MKISHRVRKARANVAHIGNRIDELESKREAKIDELQDMCHHEFISEYDDIRICEICCLEEGHEGTGYDILNIDRVRDISLDQLCEIRQMRTEI